MACVRCEQNKVKITMGNNTSALPLQATDIQVVEYGDTHAFTTADWPMDRHVLLVLIPETFTPVCKGEWGAMNKWYQAFAVLGCEVIILCPDRAPRIAEWSPGDPAIANPLYKAFSSYLLPSRLGLVEDGRAKRASVFVLKSGE